MRIFIKKSYNIFHYYNTKNILLLVLIQLNETFKDFVGGPGKIPTGSCSG